MLRLRTMLALTAGFAGGYVAGSGRGGALMEQARTTLERVLGETGLTDAGHQVADAGRDVADAAGSRIHGVVDDAAANAADRVAKVADRLDPEVDGPDDSQDPDHGVTVAPTPPQGKS